MNAQELLLPNGKPSHVWFCEKCGITSPTKACADKCCNWKCERCGCATMNFCDICNKCQSLKFQEQESKRFTGAIKLEPKDCTGPVFNPRNDEYYSSVDDMYDCCDLDKLPEYVWCCTVSSWVKVDGDDILSALEGNEPEDFDLDDLDGWEELEAALAKFCEVNEGHKAWEPDYTRACVLTPMPEGAHR